MTFVLTSLNTFLRVALVVTSSWKGTVNMYVRVSRSVAIRSALLTSAFLVLTYFSPLRSLFAHDEPPPGSGGSYTPDTCVQGHNVCGDFEPLTPMHGAEGVHAGLIWKDRAAMPKMLYWARFTDYKGIDVADPAVIQAKINAGALTDKKNVNDFNAAIRGGDFPGGAANSFKALVYGGFNIIQGLSQSVPTRILGELQHDRAQIFDISHPDAFKNADKFDTVSLDDSDFALNAAAFKDAGEAAGLHYNLYCSGHASLSDGRLVIVGGHDMNSNNGLFKVNIFDPQTETWAPRAQPCTQANWRRDPFGAKLFASNPSAKFYPGCNPLDIKSTQPADRSDMKYARWYPTAIALPGDLVLVLGGTDQDATIGPSPVPFPNLGQSDAAFRASKHHITVPEIYDPHTDRTIALENARRIFPIYPQAEVVQTGPDPNDWKVCAVGAPARPLATNDPFLKGEPFATFDGPYTGGTFCLDVRGAMKDPNRDVPGQNHWTHVADIADAEDYCCPTASLTELGSNGKTLSHKVVIFSSKIGANGNLPSKAVQMIDYANPVPLYEQQGDLIQTGSFYKAIALPDGKVLVTSGKDGTRPLQNYEERNVLPVQLFDPSTGTVTKLAKTTVSRGLHGNALLLPDATVMIMGDDRINLVPPGDRAYPPGDPDQGVANGQIFRPPYLFSGPDQEAVRPVILDAPDEISYRGHFDVRVDGLASRIKSVSIIRTDFDTHSLESGEKYVKLSFRVKGHDGDDKGHDGDGKGHDGDGKGHDRDGKGKDGGGVLRIDSPDLPAQALQGHYMLFVLDEAGVPSVAKHVRLKLDNEGRRLR